MGWLGGSSAPQSESVTIPVHRIDRDSLLLSEISDKSSYPNPSIILKIQFFIL